jgi:hypothetical protein
LIAYSTEEKVYIKNIITDKQLEIEIEDVSIISWSDENTHIFFGTEHGHIAGYKFDHQLFK